MNNKSNWDASREVYLTYRTAKRRLNHATKAHNRTFRKLETAFARFSRAQTEALLEYNEASQTQKFADAYENLRQAKIEHDATHNEISAALKNFKKIEIKYSVVIINGLLRIGVRMVDVERIFGIWASNINRWLRLDKNRDTENLSKIYDDEFDQ